MSDECYACSTSLNKNFMRCNAVHPTRVPLCSICAAQEAWLVRFHGLKPLNYDWESWRGRIIGAVSP